MNHLESLQNKIISNWNDLKNELAYWQFKNKKIVFTNGCFDLVHRGHIEYLAQAASLGDILVLGLNTDNSVKRLKGETRPLQDEMARAHLLAGMSFISKVVLFDEDTPYELIKFIQPDALIKGSDYNPEDIVGYDIVKAKGGEIITMDFVPGYSTTSIVDKIRKENG